MGLAMNLMRNGYLTLMAPDLKKAQAGGGIAAGDTRADAVAFEERNRRSA